MVQMRRADLDELKKFYGDEAAKRREAIMATLLATQHWTAGSAYVANLTSMARELADAVMEAAK